MVKRIKNDFFFLPKAGLHSVPLLTFHGNLGCNGIFFFLMWTWVYITHFKPYLHFYYYLHEGK